MWGKKSRRRTNVQFLLLSTPEQVNMRKWNDARNSASTVDFALIAEEKPNNYDNTSMSWHYLLGGLSLYLL
jgi:hypothetical protein